jgi:hypothetical protein
MDMKSCAPGTQASSTEWILTSIFDVSSKACAHLRKICIPDNLKTTRRTGSKSSVTSLPPEHATLGSGQLHVTVTPAYQEIPDISSIFRLQKQSALDQLNREPRYSATSRQDRQRVARKDGKEESRQRRAKVERNTKYLGLRWRAAKTGKLEAHLKPNPPFARFREYPATSALHLLQPRTIGQASLSSLKTASQKHCDCFSLVFGDKNTSNDLRARRALLRAVWDSKAGWTLTLRDLRNCGRGPSRENRFRSLSRFELLTRETRMIQNAINYPLSFHNHQKHNKTRNTELQPGIIS